ncbi:hypothetical protein D3C71_25480 [compost metagenome]
MSKLTVTLNRAHKIAERLSAGLGEARDLASARGAAAVNLTARPTTEQVGYIRSQAAVALKAVERFELLVGTHATLRETIAQANAKFGITAVLAQVEGNKRLIGLYGVAAGALAPNASTVHVDALTADYTWPQATAYGPGTVAATAVRSEDVARLLERKRALERQNFALTDKLAELNAKTVEIELPDELLEDLGL